MLPASTPSRFGVKMVVLRFAPHAKYQALMPLTVAPQFPLESRVSAWTAARQLLLGYPCSLSSKAHDPRRELLDPIKLYQPAICAPEVLRRFWRNPSSCHCQDLHQEILATDAVLEKCPPENCSTPLAAKPVPRGLRCQMGEGYQRPTSP